MPRLADVQLTREEALQVLGLVRARAAEVERMVQGIGEGEGMDLQRHNALKSLRPQEELLSDLTLKLEGALRDLEKQAG